MRSLPVNIPMRVLLALGLLANSIVGQGFCHTHAGGNDAHSHHAEQSRRSLSDGKCDHRDDAHLIASVSHGNESWLGAGSVSHFHLNLFGLEIFIPASNDPHEDSDESHSLALLCRHEDPAVATFGRFIDVELLRSIALTVSPQEVVEKILSAESSFPQVPTAPLCDSARFERTGVLLI